MSYLTNSKYERLMTQIPQPRQEVSLPRQAPDHLCYGCERYRQSYGVGCVHPCFREIRRKEVMI